MSLKVISRNVGYALLVSALFMFLSVIVSVLNGNDSGLSALLISFSVTFITGIFPFFFVRKTSHITLHEGYTIIVLSWLLSFIFGMLPYALWGGPFTLENAWFESVSGFTTTGATILEDIEALPKSLLFWRTSTHFIGGLGVVVFLLLIIPNSSPVRLRLTQMEVSSLSKDTYHSRNDKTVRMFAYVYLGICGVSFLCYLAAGMPAFDAICHAFSVSATGGFSTRNLSIGAFNSVTIDILTMIFMLASSTHFGIIYLTFATRALKPLKNPILGFYLSYLIVATVICTISLKAGGMEPTWGKSLLDSSFTVICYASTTGFAICDNAAWPMLPCFIIMMAGIVCGCAGSTTGGVKTDRVMMLQKAIGRQVKSILHPSVVTEIKIGRSTLRDEEIYPHLLYLSMFLIFMLLSVALTLFTGTSGSDAISGSISSLCNVGPALGDLGTHGNFNGQNTVTKFIFSVDMFLGRLEIYPVLAVISMIFKRNKN